MFSLSYTKKIIVQHNILYSPLLQHIKNYENRKSYQEFNSIIIISNITDKKVVNTVPTKSFIFLLLIIICMSLLICNSLTRDTVYYVAIYYIDQ